jgi:hypothetical protein
VFLFAAGTKKSYNRNYGVAEEMKNRVTKVLFAALVAIGFFTRAEANPWWWPVKTQAKTTQIYVPFNNGGVASVTIPTKTAYAKPKRGSELRRAKDSAIDRRDDERIAADLERHF